MRYAVQVIETLKESFNRNSAHNDDVNNKENKPVNQGLMHRRESTSLSSQQEMPKMMRSSSMQRI